MVFSSMVFLFRFLPLFLILYFAIGKEYRNFVILLGSLIFYAYGEPIYVLLMILTLFVNYKIARKIYRLHVKEKRSGMDMKYERKKFLKLALFYDFGMLFIFKYLGFFVSIIDLPLNDLIPVPKIALPLGISFYTFQVASYMIDVYRGKHSVKENTALDFCTYVAMFPQLIAGPIVNYSEVKGALRERKVNPVRIEYGVSIFILGLAYKVLLADKIGSLWKDVITIGPYGINMPTAWLGSWGFSMQLFFDFFGYSLMAIGLGHIMGFSFPSNFEDPYISKSATEFWRRWHITLGRWFREYVYIPLGGNRCSKAKWVFNIFIVWFLTGLWHGANWNFIIWGLMFFVILLIEKLFFINKLEKSKVIGHIYMLILIPVSWTIFNITELKTLGAYLKVMFFIPLEGAVKARAMERFWSLFGTYWWLLLICAFCCLPWPVRWIKKYYKTWPAKIILLGLFWFVIYELALSGSGDFLYFRF